MSNMSFEMLSTAQVAMLAPQLEKLYDKSCAGNEIVEDEMTGRDIVELGMSGMAAIFAGFYKNKLTFTLAIQFNMTNGRKGADLIGMAGKKILAFKAQYWGPLLEWLKINGVEFLDAYTDTDRTNMYTKKFGFNKSCDYMRISLQ